MKSFDFYLANAAMNNGAAAKIREATRAACLCYALDKIGFSSCIVGASPAFMESNRWPFFKHLHSAPRRGTERVRMMEELNINYKTEVAIKCSVKPKRDAALRSFCKVLVAHELAPEMNGIPGIVDVPFLIHDDVVEAFIATGLFQAYLDDDIATIRKSFDFTKRLRVGFRGTGWPNRQTFFEGCPDWVDVAFHPMGQPPMQAWDHVKWLASMQASPALAGDTPKTNLPPTLALLGIPIIAPSPEINAVPLGPDSMIYSDGRNWDEVLSILMDGARMNRIAEAATCVYKSGWSPLGQARLIAEAAS